MDTKMHVLTLKDGYTNKEMVLRVPVESDINEWCDSIRTMLVFLTFSEATINQVLEEYHERDSEENHN